MNKQIGLIKIDQWPWFSNVEDLFDFDGVLGGLIEVNHGFILGEDALDEGLLSEVDKNRSTNKDQKGHDNGSNDLQGVIIFHDTGYFLIRCGRRVGIIF